MPGEAVDMEALLTRLRAGPRPVHLVRPCIPGDGLAPLPVDPPDPDLLGPARITTFVPASGAATRLFHALRRVAEAGLPSLDAVDTYVDEHPALRPARAALHGWGDLALSRHVPGDPARDLPGLLRGLLDSGLLDHPKGIVPFHLTPHGTRTAIEEHLREAAAVVHGLDDVVRVHLTVPEDGTAAFRQAIDAAVDQVTADLGVRILLETSTQDPATDTPALGRDGQAVLDGGRPWLRPGGHGALLGNLALPDTDILLIKNVDNVVHRDHAAPVLAARRQLLSALARLVSEHRDVTARAARGELAQARAWLDSLGYSGPVTEQAVLADLDRPLRVAGMVPNGGHPGGGPFFVRGADGRLTPQIVEGVEVDHDDPRQATLWRRSTHFNPVELACWRTDPHGRPYDLTRFVDDTRWILTDKTHAGEPVRVLERPGLWNGSMSGWLTRMIALPAGVFHPVKTLADLLEPAHRPT